MSTDDWVPNNQDVLQARLRTTGIAETSFALGHTNWLMVDVGGQRSERKKWIHCFENVDCLIFVAALSGYDQCLAEDRNAVCLISLLSHQVGYLTSTQNQMHEAMMLFDSLANSKWFMHKPIILFLNKFDVFKKKLDISPLSWHFPDYNGSHTDLCAAVEYVASRFKALNRTRHREIYTHYTNATDTTLLKATMESVQDMIVRRNLRSLELLR